VLVCLIRLQSLRLLQNLPTASYRKLGHFPRQSSPAELVTPMPTCKWPLSGLFTLDIGHEDVLWRSLRCIWTRKSSLAHFVDHRQNARHIDPSANSNRPHALSHGGRFSTSCEPCKGHIVPSAAPEIDLESFYTLHLLEVTVDNRSFTASSVQLITLRSRYPRPLK